MKKGQGLKDKILCLYADYSYFGVVHEGSFETLQKVLDLSRKLENNHIK